MPNIEPSLLEGELLDPLTEEREDAMCHDKGFSLIELLIVVAIILIISAIAIPNLIKAKLNANEASATNTLRMLNHAEVTYAATFSSGYTDGLNRLGPPSAGMQPDYNRADLLDPVLSGLGPGGTNTNFVKSGYIFTFTPGAGAFGVIGSYALTADPQSRGSTGQRSFFTNEPLVIRANPTAAATATDKPL